MGAEFWSTLVAGGTAVVVMAFIFVCIMWFWTVVVREAAKTTDERAFVALMERFYIKMEKQVTPDKGVTWPPELGAEYTMEANSCPAVNGYNGFVCVFDFDKNGKSLGMGIWE